MQYDFLKADYQAARDVVLTATTEEQTVTLRRPLLVSGTVTDAHTCQPVRGFRIITGVVTPENFRLWGRAAARTGDDDGHYTESFDEPASLHDQNLLRVEADGYRSAVSRRIDDAEGQVTLNFTLEPGEGSEGSVLAPDGAPAAGAKIAVVFPGRPAAVQDGVLYHDPDHVEATADTQERFRFASQDGLYLVVITHPAGFARLTAEQFAANPTVHLTAWGRVEVAVSPADLPAPGRRAGFYLTDRPPDSSGPTIDQPVAYFDHTAQPGKDGASVVYDKVPPGDWWFGRYGQVTTYALPVHVLPEETARLSLSGERSITGRLNVADIREKADLTQCQVNVSLKLPPPPVPENLAVPERQAWFTGWSKTEAGKAYNSSVRTYHGEMEADGAFRCDGLLAGKEYELHIMLLKSGQDASRPQLILYYARQFLLPEGKEAYDLGEAQALSPGVQSVSVQP